MTYVICLSIVGYPASLEVRKVYVTLPDRTAEKVGMIRVIDESGSDYLFPQSQFAAISLPRKVKVAFSRPRRRRSLRRVAVRPRAASH